MNKVFIKFAKHQKLPEGYRIEWWEYDERYHWVIDDANYSVAFSTRWQAFRSAWVNAKEDNTHHHRKKLLEKLANINPY